MRFIEKIFLLPVYLIYLGYKVANGARTRSIGKFNPTTGGMQLSFVIWAFVGAIIIVLIF